MSGYIYVIITLLALNIATLIVGFWLFAKNIKLERKLKLLESSTFQNIKRDKENGNNANKA